MAEVDLQSDELKKIVNKELNRKPDTKITDEDVKKIRILKLNQNVIDELLKNKSGGLHFFENVEVLSISDADVNNTKVLEFLTRGIKELILVNCAGVDIKKFSEFSNITKLTAINCKDANFKEINSFKDLSVVNLANNDWMHKADIEDLWKIDNLQEVNLDGTPQLEVEEREGIVVSHEAEYRPGESQGWGEASRIGPESYTAKALENPKIINNLQGKYITISLKDTSEITLEQLENLKKQGVNIDRIYVNTGWKETQNRGYSLDTFLAIKERMKAITEEASKKENGKFLLSKQERYLQVRESIINSIKYDYAALSTTPRDKDYYASRNLENGLLEGTCVCAGYADIFKNALAEVGIESKYVEGKTKKGELHAWLQVNLGENGVDKWYNDDITWDAVNRAAGKNRYQYCLMTDEEFGKTHGEAIPERTEGPVMECKEQPPEAVKSLRQPVRQINKNGFDR